MATGPRVVFYPGQIAALAGDPAVQANVRLDAARMARMAAVAAPRLTGAGAASIQADTDPVNRLGQRVAWDEQHYYMIFHEDGFAGHPGSHFLRRTFESYIHV